MEDSERRKAIELLKEMRTGNKEEGKSNSQTDGLNWMYKGPLDLIDKEEYLLGKAIDKTFEALNSANSSDVVGRTGEQSNIPKRLLEKTDSTEQVDIAKKILEDPLYAIKQKEMEARKKLLNNPIKLKQIKQMLLERIKQNNAQKKPKKNSEEKLNILIIKKLKKFTDNEKRKALNIIIQSDSDSSSAKISSSSGREEKKHKLRRKKAHSFKDDSESSSETASSSESEKTKSDRSRKRKNESNKKKQNKKSKESNSDIDSSSSERNIKAKNKKSKSKKYSKKMFSIHVQNSVSSKSSSYSEVRNSRKDFKVKHERKNSTEGSKWKRSPGRDEEKRKSSRRDISSDKDGKSKKNYGLMISEGSKPAVRKWPVLRYEKSTETKTKYVSQPKAKPLSDKEREKKLREMMQDAKLRKQDQENNLESHRKKQAQEEELKDYDEDFMRRQMKHLTSQGTIADRIKSNINNIQRSKFSMDSSFMQK